jgi:hypothetical protein
MVLTTLEVIGCIAMRPTNLDKNAYFGRLFCHMQQIFLVAWQGVFFLEFSGCFKRRAPG